MDNQSQDLILELRDKTNALTDEFLYVKSEASHRLTLSRGQVVINGIENKYKPNVVYEESTPLAGRKGREKKDATVSGNLVYRIMWSDSPVRISPHIHTRSSSSSHLW